MRRSLAPRLLVLAHVLLFPVATQAAERTVRVTVDPCVGIVSAAVERIVAAEVLSDAPESGEPTGSDNLVVRVACVEDRLAVSVEGGRSTEARSRSLNLAEEKPEARPRILALAIAELLSHHLVTPAQSAVEAKSPAPPLEARSPGRPQISQPRPEALRIETVAVARGVSGVMGYGAGVGGRVGGTWGGRAHIDYTYGAVGFASGRVSEQLASAGAAVSFAPLRTAVWEFDASLGARGGAALLRGAPAAGARAGSITAPYFGPKAELHLLFRPTREVGLLVGLDVMWVARGVDGTVDGAVRVRVADGVFGGTLGVTVSP